MAGIQLERVEIRPIESFDERNEPEDYGPSVESQGKDPAAVALGRKGGKARAAGMSARKRKEIARKAAKIRWGT